MRNLTYQVNSGVRVQHVFTGNQEILQQDATKLLLDIQKDVILSRSDLHSMYPCCLASKTYEFLVSGPYFTWSTNLDHGNICSGDPAGQPEISRLVFDIQDTLLHYMQAYGEVDDANINHITIQAWATPGSKRVSQKGHSILFFSPQKRLGCRFSREEPRCHHHLSRCRSRHESSTQTWFYGDPH